MNKSTSDKLTQLRTAAANHEARAANIRQCHERVGVTDELLKVASDCEAKARAIRSEIKELEPAPPKPKKKAKGKTDKEQP